MFVKSRVVALAFRLIAVGVALSAWTPAIGDGPEPAAVSGKEEAVHDTIELTAEFFAADGSHRVGEIVAAPGMQGTVRIEMINQLEEELHLNSIALSCSCVSGFCEPRVVPPGERATLTLTVEAPRDAGVSRQTAQIRYEGQPEVKLLFPIRNDRNVHLAHSPERLVNDDTYAVQVDFSGDASLPEPSVALEDSSLDGVTVSRSPNNPRLLLIDGVPHERTRPEKLVVGFGDGWSPLKIYFQPTDIAKNGYTTPRIEIGLDVVKGKKYLYVHRGLAGDEQEILIAGFAFKTTVMGKRVGDGIYEFIPNVSPTGNQAADRVGVVATAALDVD